jgi:hypothetical protein
MTLCRFVYSSQGLPSLHYPDLMDIMEKSEKNNALVGLTGMLCFGDSMFLQVLEGDRQAVSNTYHRIVKDPRHCNFAIIECVEADQRLFGAWSMKTVQLGSYFPDRVKDIVIKYSPTSTFDPNRMNARQCLQFMLDLQALYKEMG